MENNAPQSARLIDRSVGLNSQGNLIACAQCGTLFHPNKNAKYCSKECRRKKHEENLPPKQPKTCAVCGAIFYTRVSSQVLCGSLKCKRQWSRVNAKKNTQKFAGLREFYIFERDNFTCAYCGKSSYADGVKLHVDHVVPKATGGASVVGNLITSCATCNITKKTMELACVNDILAVISDRNLVRGIPNDTLLFSLGETFSLREDV